jgi:hypothetical protein
MDWEEDEDQVQMVNGLRLINRLQTLVSRVRKSGQGLQDLKEDLRRLQKAFQDPNENSSEE